MNDAITEARALIEPSEQCRLKAYPDPKWHRVPRTAANWHEWGKPWTCGWGETEGVTEDTIWTQDEADRRRDRCIAIVLLGVVKRCPQLHLEPPKRVAACVSLAYNIGLGAFAASSVCRLTKSREYERAAASFGLWNKAGGRVLRGLTLRRQLEAAAYMAA
ncbi:lysozyme [Massilia agilis]|uniref:Lysozyme n=1 Tax=Massilia agilis TaxID=1811226 RepID=A0ABT2DE40_9BURK|nr:lysozyme [Massilia agilis]MCS0808698.1 lysozyme [Massilia agilis]